MRERNRYEEKERTWEEKKESRKVDIGWERRKIERDGIREKERKKKIEREMIREKEKKRTDI